MKTNDLKIAIVHEFLTKIGGAEKVLKTLHEMFPEAPIFTLINNKETIDKLFTDSPTIFSSSLNKYPEMIKNKPKLLLAKYPQAIEEFCFSEFDIVISSSNSFAHGIITPPKTFHLSYCHSPMRYVWDYAHEYLEENNIGFNPKGLFVRNILHNVRIWDKVAAERVDAWIANSENVQKRITKYYQKNSTVVYPPVDVEKIELNENLPDDYYVIVSRLEPYKKIELAIDAFNENKKPLVVIGTGSNLSALKKRANSNIEFLGWQSNKSKFEYLKNAKALIFSGEDDAGITPIESMACGRPVVAYKKGGVVEIIKEGETGLFFEESTKESLLGAVEKLEKNYLRFIPVNCRKQAEKFSLNAFQENFNKILTEEFEKYKKQFK